MPKVNHVKKARKDNPVAKRGEPYYWWKFRYGGKHFSLTYPKQSQLTQSPYLTVIYECQDAWSEVGSPDGEQVTFSEKENIVSSLQQAADSMDSVVENLRELVDQYEESATNMEEYFPGAEKVDMLRDSGQACEETCDEIDNMVQSVRDASDEISGMDDPDESLPSDEYEEAVEEWEMAAQDVVDQMEFDEPNFDFHEL